MLSAETHAFRGVLGAKVIICKPAGPEAQGLLERVHGYLGTSFLPGRSFAGPADFKAQLGEFFQTANPRWRAMGCAPIDRLAAGKAAMLPLPPGTAMQSAHPSPRSSRKRWAGQHSAASAGSAATQNLGIRSRFQLA